MPTPGQRILIPWILWSALAISALLALTTKGCAPIDQYDPRTPEQATYDQLWRQLMN
jgi:hypothetical protein